MITAKEFIVSNEVKQGFLLTNSTDELEDIIKSHIEFAKLHVEAALKAACENVEVNYNLLEDYNKTLLIDENIEVYAINSSILNAYPLENIK